MNPKLFAQAIVSIEQKYGLRLNVQETWLRLDGTPCGRGWVGTKPGCKRGKSVKEAGALKSNVLNATEEEVKGRKKKKEEAPRDLSVKTAEVLEKNKVPTGTSADSPKFERVSGLQNLDKEWGADIKKASSHQDHFYLIESFSALTEKKKMIDELKPGEEKVLLYPGERKPLKGTKEQWTRKIQKDRVALAEQIRSKPNKLDKTLDSEKIADNLNILESIQELSKSKSEKIISGGVSNGGKLQAAYVLSKKKNHLYVEYLAANPASFLKTGGTKGAGRAAIIDIVKRSFDEGYNGKVKLEALPGASGFYKKMGFTESGKDSFELSPEQAKKILEGKF